jgi:hypothetical protein
MALILYTPYRYIPLTFDNPPPIDKVSPHLPYRGAGDDFSQNSQKLFTYNM